MTTPSLRPPSRSFKLPDSPIPVTAVACGERIDVRRVEGQRVSAAPPIVHVGERGLATVLRFGSVVFFAASKSERREFLESIRELTDGYVDAPEEEEAELILDPDAVEHVGDGRVVLHSLDVSQMQVIAIVLAKSASLAHYEEAVEQAFRPVEQVALDMGQGRAARRAMPLVKHIGAALGIEHQMVWRMEVGDKPELLWDRPELERLHARLTEEYELAERDRALGRKLQLMQRTASTLLSLLNERRSLHLEWAIVILIVVEIVIMLLEMGLS